MEKYVISGGACSGKTSLIEEIEKRGYETIPEAARIVASEGELRPWENFEEFQRKVIEKQFKFEEYIEKSDYGKVFLDRSPIDTYVYSKHKSMKFEPEIIEKLEGLEYEEVFLLDILDNYKTDELRKESKKETEEIHENIKKAYQEFGYKPIRIPEFKTKNPIEERADFVLERII